ncbi:uncharacterized protein LOC141582176 [Saimiri boliviensis]|uniref:uncharacterized protein LOC141582176 n=1 Tax=Saimiri boliviensis TaxID=27679 RepID=UPI003D788364
MCLDFFSSVPGSSCGAPNVSMATPVRTCSTTTTEVNFPHTIDNSYSQQEETKPNFRDSKYRLLMSQVAYFRNCQLKTYKDRKDHNEEQKYRDSKNKLIMSQVAYYLGCRLKTEVPGFLCSARNVNMVASDRPPSRKYTEVNVAESIEKSCPQQEEIKPNVGASKNGLLMSQVAYVLNCRERTYNDQEDHDEVQKYRDSQNKLLMSRAASDLGCRLKTEENDRDEDEDVHVAEAERIQESLVPRLIGEVPKVDIRRVPEDSLKDCVITASNSYGPTDSSQPHGDTSEITFEEDNVECALVAESPSSPDVVEDALIILSESQHDDEEEQEKGPVPPRNPQESVEEEASQESWDEGYSTLSVPPGTSAFSEPYRSNLHSLEEQQVDLARDIDKIKISKKRKTKAHHAPGQCYLTHLQAEKVPCVSRHDCDARTVPPSIYHHDHAPKLNPGKKCRSKKETQLLGTGKNGDPPMEPKAGVNRCVKADVRRFPPQTCRADDCHDPRTALLKEKHEIESPGQKICLAGCKTNRGERNEFWGRAALQSGPDDSFAKMTKDWGLCGQKGPRPLSAAPLICRWVPPHTPPLSQGPVFPLCVCLPDPDSFYDAVTYLRDRRLWCATAMGKGVKIFPVCSLEDITHEKDTQSEGSRWRFVSGNTTRLWLCSKTANFIKPYSEVGSVQPDLSNSGKTPRIRSCVYLLMPYRDQNRSEEMGASLQDFFPSSHPRRSHKEASSGKNSCIPIDSRPHGCLKYLSQKNGYSRIMSTVKESNEAD